MHDFQFKYSATIACDPTETSPILFKGDLYSNIIKSQKYGFDAVELHIRRPCNVNVEKIKHCCFQNNIVVSTIGTGMSYVMDGLSITDIDALKRENAVNRLKEYINLARELNCGVIIGSMRGKIAYEEFNRYMSIYSNILSELSYFAECRNVPLYIEAINRYEVNFHNTMEELVKYLKSLNSSNIKILIDTFHMNIEESNIEKSIIEHAEYIGHVHLADNNRMYPGAGCFDFESLVHALKKINYNGYMAFECFPYPDSDTAAKKGLQYFRTLELKSR